jgi:signal transduction histidine kinase
VRALAEDTNGVLWIGTETEGLFTLKDGMFRAESPLMKDISCLLVSADNTVWVGSLVHGLSRYVNGAWRHFTSTTAGLSNDDIGSLAEDAVGNLWIGSFEGLVRIPKKSFEEVQSGSAETLTCRTFLTRECSAGAQPATLRARDGKLWFPTIEGLVSVNPADLQPNTNPPPVVIESVLVDGVKLKTNALISGWSRAVTLPPDHEQLEIHFTALNFSATKDTRLGTRFKYSIDEVARKNSVVNFTDVGGERVVHFNRLSPGDYNFHVIACNEDGIWNRTGAWLKITVEPPFWRTPGFIAVSVLVLLGALAGVIYLISTAKLKRELRVLHQKELIERERARIARDLHDQLGANLTQVTLLGEMAELDKELPAEVEQHAQQICATARETTRSLDEIVWAVNPSNDTLEGLANYACKYAQDYFALAGISYRAELPADLPPTPILPEVRHNIFLAFKEAVNNVVKHAHATEARVKLSLEPEQFVLSITDNGRGLGDISAKKLRNGMKNMRKRLADVHGEFDIAPGANGGTVVQLRVPISKPKN